MHVLVIGSSVIDLFLALDQDHFKLQDKNVELLLGDKIPSQIQGHAIGGNGANVSVGLTKLEIPTTFYTYLGSDFFSREIENGLSSQGVELDTERHPEGASPLHLILDFPGDRIIISNYGKNEHNFNPREQKYDYIFLTSIPDIWEEAYKKILSYSKENNIPIAFSPGTRQIEDKNELTLEVIKNSKAYFSNKEEAMKILNYESGSMNQGEDKDLIKKLLIGFKELGVETVSITDGANGAYAADKNGDMYHINPAPTEGKEKTGAGDAYASGFFGAILTGLDTPTAMLWGALNADNKMQKIGAENGLLTKKELDEKTKSNNLEAVKI
ncbi:MAG TPA: carbohydrate kinase family protein [Patescibacteria group bacterium]|nr:carbohydrate kinase family protein [Patescibacteria group bacterium]